MFIRPASKYLEMVCVFQDALYRSQLLPSLTLLLFAFNFNLKLHIILVLERQVLPAVAVYWLRRITARVIQLFVLLPAQEDRMSFCTVRDARETGQPD